MSTFENCEVCRSSYATHLAENEDGTLHVCGGCAEGMSDWKVERWMYAPWELRQAYGKVPAAARRRLDRECPELRFDDPRFLDAVRPYLPA